MDPLCMKTNDTIQLAVKWRPWLSLWVTIHFFVLGIFLFANVESSALLRRMTRLLGPYAVFLHQDYGAVPLAMTRGGQSDYPHLLQFHARSDDASLWRTVPTDAGPFGWLDRRAENFSHMVSIVAEEKNEELVHLLFEQAILQASQQGVESVDGVRLVRQATLSYTQALAARAGELPTTEMEDKVLFECRVLDVDGQTKLLPVLEPTRRARSVEPRP
jgi:hypothetical protein